MSNTNLVDLDIRTTANSSAGDIPIYVGATFGPIPIDSSGAYYDMHVRSASLRLTFENCKSIHPQKRYREKLSPESISVRQKFSERRDASFHASGNITAEIDAPIVKGKAEGGGSRKTAKEAQQVTEANPDISLIQPLPRDEWRIGDTEFGDPRQPNHSLDGPYLDHDCHNNDNDQPTKPLCYVISTAQDSPANLTVTAELSVTIPRDVHIVRSGDQASDSPISQTEREEKFKPAFVDRLRSLKLCTALSVTGRYVIARETLSLSLSGEDVP